MTTLRGVTVGYSQGPPDTNNFRGTVSSALARATDKVCASLLVASANGDPIKQSSDIRQLVGRGAQLLIVQPVVECSLSAGSAEAPAHHVDEQRLHASFAFAAAALQDAGFDRAKAESAMTRLLAAHPEIDAVFAENDDMGLGAWLAIKAAGRVPGIGVRIVSVDGTRDAVAKIIEGGYNATVTSDPFVWPVALKAFADFEFGPGVPATVLMSDHAITPANAREQLATAL